MHGADPHPDDGGAALTDNDSDDTDVSVNKMSETTAWFAAQARRAAQIGVPPSVWYEISQQSAQQRSDFLRAEAVTSTLGHAASSSATSSHQ